MVRVMMAAPFEAGGRYQGGIHAIVNSVMGETDTIAANGIEIIPFNTCRIERKNDSIGKLSLENLKNFSLVYRDVVPELRTAQADVFYLHSSVGIALLKDLMVLRQVNKKTDCKTIVHIHFAEIDKILTGKAILDNWILHALKKYVDGIVFLSRKTMEQFVDCGIAQEKCHVIYNFSTLSYENEELFSGAKENPLEFLFVGSVDDRKGIFDALAVLEEVTEPYTLHVCGGFGNAENEAQFRTYQEKLGDKLKFHGFVKGDEKRQLFQKADVLLLPSYGEGLPVVILEAFSAGCGVITTNVGAIPEIVDAANGLVIAPGDCKALKDGLLSYLHMDEQELRKQKQGNFTLAKQYTLDMFIQKTADTCKAVYVREMRQN